MNIEFYKLSGILAFAIAWSGMLATIFSQGRHGHKSISLHAASSKKTFLLLAILSPLSMGLFAVFVIRWMMPTFNLPQLFAVLNVTAFAGYILAAWVPAVGGRKEKLHDLFAYTASLLLIPISFVLAISPTIAPLARLINAISVAVMVSVFCILFWHKPARKNYLYFQMAYFLVFDIGLLGAGYIQ